MADRLALLVPNTISLVPAKKTASVRLSEGFEAIMLPPGIGFEVVSDASEKFVSGVRKNTSQFPPTPNYSCQILHPARL